MEDDIVRAALAPEHPGVGAVVPHHDALLAVGRLVDLLDPRLVGRGLHRAPPGVRRHLDRVRVLHPLRARASFVRLRTLASGPLSVSARARSPEENELTLVRIKTEVIFTLATWGLVSRVFSAFCSAEPCSSGTATSLGWSGASSRPCGAACQAGRTSSAGAGAG